MQKAFRGSTSPYDIFTHAGGSGTGTWQLQLPGSLTPGPLTPVVLVCFPQVLLDFFLLFFFLSDRKGCKTWHRRCG